ncbi:MAG: cellulose biosynthesis cyclic di-GMP-binding regulatory protein BcsB [Solirubrobacteraceae bacterium]|nr:cellulose biosynthesis cyclic di-GMP-binding regulatory protein BcsB [Solirubrobacteraceae bacterium]
MPRRLAAACALLGSALTFGGVAVAPASASERVPFVELGQAPIKLSGGLAQFQGSIAIPGRWSAWRGEVRLNWTGSTELAEGSAIRVSVGGAVVGTSEVTGGAGSATFRIPESKARDGVTTLPVLIEARLKTKRAQCPGPDDLSAYLQFSQSSGIVIDGDWARQPLRLKDLPDAAVTTVGRGGSPLLVRFAQKPTPELIGAAAIAAGEISAAAGSGGVKLRVSQPGAELEPRDTEAVVTLSQTAGPGTLAVAASVGNAPRIIISGAADQLVQAAGGMRASIARGLPGASSSKLPKISIKRTGLPRRIQLPAGSFNGYGSGTVGLEFQLPVYREALRGARLRMSVSYDAPAGGRAEVIVNGRSIATETLRRRGSTRFDVEEQLAGRGPALQRADLRPGTNQVQVNADLNYPATRCSLPEQTGAVTVSDFGSVTLLTRERPVLSTLSTLPFPLSRTAGWKGSTVQVPVDPTSPELASVLGMMAEARRVTGEQAMPTYRIANDVPTGTAFILSRPGAVPAELTEGIPGPIDEGVLAASGNAKAVKILAIGRRALIPLTSNYSIGNVQGRVVQVLRTGDVAVRLNDVQRVTGVERGATSWRWPLIVIAVAVLGLTLLGLRGAIRRVRRDDA